MRPGLRGPGRAGRGGEGVRLGRGRMADYSGYFCSGPAGIGSEPHVFREIQIWGVWACHEHFVPSTGMLWAQISGIS